MPKKPETVATVRESFEKVKTTHAAWPIESPLDEAYRFEVTSLGVQGIIGAANAELPDSEERRRLVEEMAQWLKEVQPAPQRLL